MVYLYNDVTPACHLKYQYARCLLARYALFDFSIQVWNEAHVITQRWVIINTSLRVPNCKFGVFEVTNSWPQCQLTRVVVCFSPCVCNTLHFNESQRFGEVVAYTLVHHERQTGSLLCPIHVVLLSVSGSDTAVNCCFLLLNHQGCQSSVFRRNSAFFVCLFCFVFLLSADLKIIFRFFKKIAPPPPPPPKKKIFFFRLPTPPLSTVRRASVNSRWRLGLRFFCFWFPV